jgi:histidyl-tRNA synthetase
VGVEAVGASDPLLDAEVVALALDYYKSLGIENVRTRLNSIGCPTEGCRPRYRTLLRERRW